MMFIKAIKTSLTYFGILQRNNIINIQGLLFIVDFMKLNSGFFFGLTSGVITTLGLIIGLYFATASFAAIITGIITIAIADALSDALGIHISKESEKRFQKKQCGWKQLALSFQSLLLLHLF